MSRIITSNYIAILQILTDEELISFEKWLKSPWCTSNKNLAVLFSKLKKYHPDFTSIKLSDEQLFRRAFPKKKYSYHAMRNLFSESYRQAERFLTHQHLLKKEHFQKKFLAEEFQVRHQEDPFFKILEKEINRLEEKEIKDWEDHYDLLDLNRQAYNHPNPNPRVSSERSIIKMDQHLGFMYLLEKAAIINEKIFRNRILKNENHDVEKDLRIWNMATEGIQHISIEFYKRRFAYSEENMLEEYWNLRNDFFTRFDSLNRKEKKSHLIALINDTVNLRRKKLIDISESFPLYKLGLDSEILIENGVISRVTYVTIVVVSNVMKNFDFTNQFIQQYSPYLLEEIRTDGISWAKAHTYYRQGRFDDCLNILLTHNFKAAYFRLVGKTLTTQAYFDLFLKDSSYQSYCLDYCSSFEKWIQREYSRSKNYKESFIRFIQKCRTMVKMVSETKFDEEALNTLFDDEKNIQAINWLRQKQIEILELKKK